MQKPAKTLIFLFCRITRPNSSYTGISQPIIVFNIEKSRMTSITLIASYSDNSPKGQMTVLAHASMRVASIITRHLLTHICRGYQMPTDGMCHLHDLRTSDG